jgi:hypothetical protein
MAYCKYSFFEVVIFVFLPKLQLKLPGAMQIEIRVPKIRIPQEAYKFVAAMDRLIGHLPVEAPADPKAGIQKRQ